MGDREELAAKSQVLGACADCLHHQRGVLRKPLHLSEAPRRRGQELENFFCKGQVENVVGLVDPVASVATIRICCCSTKATPRQESAPQNIVAVGAGFCDGLHCGDNTKAAVIRLGLMEMIAFARIFCKGHVSTATFLESCGVADLITTCYGGRNRRVAEAFARTGKTIEELEKEMLNGQKLQGPQTSAEVYRILKQKGLLDKFPLFTAVYQICYEGKPIQEMLLCLQSHPEHR
nr:PREDICTED: glycerol-3-phosphate dehydrogenase 1-like protein [Equus przewalskii]